MKLAVLSSSVFAVPLQGYGGLELVAYESAKWLAALGHKVTLFAPDGSTCPGCDVFHTGLAGQWDEGAAFNVYGGELAKFDVVIDHTWQKWSYVLKGMGQLKAPVLGVLHAPVNTMISSMPDGVEKPCFVCISQDQANHFEALFGRRAAVCYNGIDLDFYKPTGAPRTNRFLFLGRYSSIKGGALALEACKKAGVGLDMVGDTSITNEPDYFQHCMNLAAETPGAVVHGGASRGECVHWFSQAHCLLHPVRDFREPFGLAPVEAMACGCPVIAWRNGAMSETVSKDAGWLVSSHEELVGAIRNCTPAFMGGVAGQITRRRCREWASNFSVQNMARRYEALATEALDTGGW